MNTRKLLVGTAWSKVRPGMMVGLALAFDIDVDVVELRIAENVRRIRRGIESVDHEAAEDTSTGSWRSAGLTCR